MIIISHRKNSIKELQDTPTSHGVEIDLRSKGNNIILSHDPFKDGFLFDDWLNYYNHRFLILNVKDDGMEEKIISLLKKNGISNYFFLDQSMPSIIRSLKLGINDIALRISEYESVNDALLFKDQCKWIWLDSFNNYYLSFSDFKKLKFYKFKLCLVSPELQGGSIDDILKTKEFYNNKKINFDAVCTKKGNLWVS